MEEFTREFEIESAMSFIQSVCERTNISLVPYEVENGKLIIAIEDNTTGQRYGLIRRENEDVKGN